MFGARCGTLASSDFNAGACAGGSFAGRAGQPAAACDVLDAGDGISGEQFQARFANQFFHERIADLHRPTLLIGGFLGQILGRKCRARKAVATRGRTDVEDGVADSFRRAFSRFGRGAEHAGVCKRRSPKDSPRNSCQNKLLRQSSGCRNNFHSARFR